MISPPRSSARRRAKALFPDPVGPRMKTRVRSKDDKADDEDGRQYGRQEKKGEDLPAAQAHPIFSDSGRARFPGPAPGFSGPPTPRLSGFRHSLGHGPEHVLGQMLDAQAKGGVPSPFRRTEGPFLEKRPQGRRISSSARFKTVTATGPISLETNLKMKAHFSLRASRIRPCSAPGETAGVFLAAEVRPEPECPGKGRRIGFSGFPRAPSSLRSWNLRREGAPLRIWRAAALGRLEFQEGGKTGRKRGPALPRSAAGGRRSSRRCASAGSPRESGRGLEPAGTVAAREHGLGIERILPVFPVEEGEHPAGEKGFGQAPKGDRAEKSQLAQSLENGEILT